MPYTLREDGVPEYNNTSNATTTIPFLTNDNYSEWLINTKALLRSKDLQEYTQERLTIQTVEEKDTEKAKAL